MINIKQLSQRYKIYDYNIGLIKATPTDVIFGNFDLCSVHWLKHKYRDRIFADPFILKETDDTLEILAEEALFLGGAATLVKLTVCTKTFQLVRRKKILSIKSHLSYPYILRWNDKVYILPENIASDKYNPQIQISAESETKRSIFREKDKTKRSKKESAQHSKSRNKSFVMTSVSAL